MSGRPGRACSRRLPSACSSSSRRPPWARISGGSFNPARSIDPALVATHLGDLWIYIIGPLVGGVLGGLVHAYFREEA